MYRFEIMFESKATDKSIMRALQSMRFTEYPILFKNDIVLGITLPEAIRKWWLKLLIADATATWTFVTVIGEAPTDFPSW